MTHHISAIDQVGNLRTPLAALALVYAGYWLDGTDLDAGSVCRYAGRPQTPESTTAALSGSDADGPVGGLRIVRQLVFEYGGDVTVKDNGSRGRP